MSGLCGHQTPKLFIAFAKAGKTYSDSTQTTPNLPKDSEIIMSFLWVVLIILTNTAISNFYSWKFFFSVLNILELVYALNLIIAWFMIFCVLTCVN